MLSLGQKINKTGIPLAYVQGGVNDKKIIFLNQEDIDLTPKERREQAEKYGGILEQRRNEINICDIAPLSDLQKTMKKRYKKDLKLSAQDYKILTKLIRSGQLPQDDRLTDVYNLLVELTPNYLKKNKAILIDDGYVQQIPRIVLCGEQKGMMIFRQYIAGPSQSGKSYYVRNLIKEYHNYNPDNKIFLFSATDDKQLNSMPNLIKMELGQDMADYPIETKELENSLCIFDDIDSIVTKDIKKAVYTLRDMILTRGRHENISCISTSHTIADNHNTRIILQESTHITVFPISTSKKNIEYVLSQYFGLDNEELDDLFKLKCRWITISKEYPRYVIYPFGVYLL